MSSPLQLLREKFNDRLKVDPELSRCIVSTQSSKKLSESRWFRYKEGFSPLLVERYLPERPGIILDPFAGCGTTLFTAAEAGWGAYGIEIMPVGALVIEARMAALLADPKEIMDRLVYPAKTLNYSAKGSYSYPHIQITKSAFTDETETAISAYMDFISTLPPKIAQIGRLAAMSVLEDCSYTKKDGQFLRWDRRAGKTKSNFTKATICSFKEAITKKLVDIWMDIDVKKMAAVEWDIEPIIGRIDVLQGSVFHYLPRIESNHFDMIMTSPPYANRYDYTRTYALELAFCGLDELAVKKLRQDLLSATVENKAKVDSLFESLSKINHDFSLVKAARAMDTSAVRELFVLLDKAEKEGRLNNVRVVDLVRNYIFEMSFVIHELARVLKPGGSIVMVNDNVQYGGEEIPLDLILSDAAEYAGLRVKEISVLPRGKGNSSQQMGKLGRKELRKCIYQWTKVAP